MATVNKKLKNLSLDDVNEISEKYLMGWHDLSAYGFRIKGFNHKRSEFGLCELTKDMSDEYRIRHIESAYTYDEIRTVIEDYLLLNCVNDTRWDGIELFGCRFGREYARLFKRLLGNQEYRRLSEKCRVKKLKDTQVDLYGGVGLAGSVTKKKALITASKNKKVFLQKAAEELQEHHCILESFSNSSVFEVFVYFALLQKFDADDIMIDYGMHPYDVRYPYPCDFYIKSVDLFIELNVHFTHGGHWFDEDNKADVLRKLHLSESNTVRSRKLLDTWCNRDVVKRKAAMNSQLNYLVFWDGTTHHVGNTLVPNLRDFYLWLYDFNADTKLFTKCHPENTY